MHASVELVTTTAQKPAPSTVRLEPGDTAPAFTLRSETTRRVSLESLLGGPSGRTGTILFFYPAASTPACTTEACDFRDSLSGLAAAGYRVVGISPDTPEANALFKQHEGLDYPLLSDENLAVHLAYGVWGEKNMYGRLVVGVKRSTFVIDPDGAIRLALYNVKATGHVAALKKKLKLA